MGHYFSSTNDKEMEGEEGRLNVKNRMREAERKPGKGKNETLKRRKGI